MSFEKTAILKMDIQHIDETLDFLDDIGCEFEEDAKVFLPRIKEELLYCKQDRLSEINLITRHTDYPDD